MLPADEVPTFDGKWSSFQDNEERPFAHADYPFGSFGANGGIDLEREFGGAPGMYVCWWRPPK